MEFFEFQEVQALKWAAEFNANCILVSRFFKLLFLLLLIYFIILYYSFNRDDTRKISPLNTDSMVNQSPLMTFLQKISNI